MVITASRPTTSSECEMKCLKMLSHEDDPRSYSLLGHMAFIEAGPSSVRQNRERLRFGRHDPPFYYMVAEAAESTCMGLFLMRRQLLCTMLFWDFFAPLLRFF